MPTNFTSGVSSYGVPILPPQGNFSAGNVWFVNSVSGSDGNTGIKPSQAFATLAKAITSANATGYTNGLQGTSTDDTIYVLAGHAESVIAAASIACSKNGLNIIGLGQGRNRPTFTWTTATTASWTVTGNNVTIKNCVFVGTGIASLVKMFAVTGDDVTFESCEFDHANATNQAGVGMTVTGCNRFRMIGNKVHGTLNAGTTNFVQIVGAASKQLDYEFIGNSFIGAYTTTLGAINNITTAVVNMVVRDNVFVNSTASSTKCIVTLTGSTGMVMRNTFGIGSGAVPITMDAGWWAGNWTAAAVATNSALI